MIVRKSNQAAIRPTPQKRSLFNKPSWSRPQALSNDTELFHRSSEMYTDLAAEAERARGRRLARKERERVRASLDGERASKRRRTSEDEDDDSYSDSSTDGSSSRSIDKEFKSSPARLNADPIAPSSSSQKPTHSPKSLIRRYEAKVAANKEGQKRRQKSKALDIIDLEDEQDSSTLTGQEPIWESAVVKTAAPPDDDDQPVSDEEFPELACQAREKARRKRLEEDMISTTVKAPDGQLSLHRPMPKNSHSDPVLRIFITSDIPNTSPLIVSRKLSQRLKDVRLAWIKRQNLTTDLTDAVFLTWRGKRVFDVTTCKSLGITVDAIGRVSLKGGSWEKEQGQIHMEVMTTKMLEAYKISKHSEVSSQEDDATQEAAILGQDHEAQVKIIMKAKGLDDFKLQVRPSTFISQILNAFRSQYEISVVKDIFLSFDGERLSPESRIMETEISDMDTLEVYCR